MLEKSRDDATINQIILETLTWGDLPSDIRDCKLIGSFLVQTPQGAWAG